MQDTPWLKYIVSPLSLRARTFNLFRYRVDLTRYVRMRRQSGMLRMFKPRHTPVYNVRLNGLPAYKVVPQGAPEAKVIFVLHGGGFVLGGGEYCRLAAVNIARATGYMAVSVDYALAPEHPFPAGLDDAFNAYNALISQGILPSDIVFYGDSAGGGLCLSLCHRLKGQGLPLPAAIIALSPATDLTGAGESRTSKASVDRLFSKGVNGVAELYAPGRDLKDPLISPLYGDFTGFPPLRIFVGENEILLSDSVDVAQKAYGQGVDVLVQVWAGMFHVFPAAAGFIPEGRRALREIAEYIKEKLG